VLRKNPVVDLFLEIDFVDKAVDFHGAGKIADALPTLRLGISCLSAKGGAKGTESATIITASSLPRSDAAIP
jgi:hypothetical protein